MAFPELERDVSHGDNVLILLIEIFGFNHQHMHRPLALFLAHLDEDTSAVQFVAGTNNRMVIPAPFPGERLVLVDLEGVEFRGSGLQGKRD